MNIYCRSCKDTGLIPATIFFSPKKHHISRHNNSYSYSGTKDSRVQFNLPAVAPQCVFWWSRKFCRDSNLAPHPSQDISLGPSAYVADSVVMASQAPVKSDEIMNHCEYYSEKFIILLNSSLCHHDQILIKKKHNFEFILISMAIGKDLPRISHIYARC